MRFFTNFRFTISLNNYLPPFQVHNIQVRFGRSALSNPPATCTTLEASKLIRSNNSFLGSITYIIPCIQFLIHLELFVFPPYICPVQSKISQTATGWWLPCAISFINCLLLDLAPSSDPDILNTSSSFDRFLICLYLVVAYHTSRIGPLIIPLEVILYSLVNFLSFKIMSSLSLGLHVLKFNPLLNISVIISALIFFVLSWNMKLCALERTLLGLN